MTHYVHYATVTKGLLQTKSEASSLGIRWSPSYHESNLVDRITDEINQAVMLHSKTTVPEYTTDWKDRCKLGAKQKHGEGCRVGLPWPGNTNTIGVEKADADGFGYNCFVNEKLNTIWIPKLRDAMEKRNDRVASLPADVFIQKTEKKKDRTRFCGHCKWKNMFECNQRVGYLMEKKGLKEREAKESLMAEGQCKPE